MTLSMPVSVLRPHAGMQDGAVADMAILIQAHGAWHARIIAAAPMFPAWPPLEKKPFADLPVTHHELWEGPLSSRLPVVIYDRHLGGDSRMVDEMVLRAYPGARLARVEHTGHGVLLAFQRARQLTPFILALLERDEIIPVELPTEDSPVWTLYRAKHLLHSHPDEARRLLERSFDLEPSRTAYATLLSMLARRNHLEDAQALIDRVAESGLAEKVTLPGGIAKLARDKGLTV